MVFCLGSEDGARSSWKEEEEGEAEGRCYEEARRRTSRSESNMADGRARLQPPVVSSVRKGSGDSYTESSEREVRGQTGRRTETGQTDHKHDRGAFLRDDGGRACCCYGDT